jgi:hypothetical protein
VSEYTAQIHDCIKAATNVLETVDYMAQDGPIFHAFWWTHYVTFCALVVTYVWEIKHGRMNNGGSKGSRSHLLRLAERCHAHLAQATASNSPSRRYAVILEEFRSLAINQAKAHKPSDGSRQGVRQATPETPSNSGLRFGNNLVSTIGESAGAANHLDHVAPDAAFVTDMPLILDDWQLADWLDLDSSVSLPLIRDRFWPTC